MPWPRRRPTRALPITLAQAEQAVAHGAVRYDRTGDQHYDVASALIKSMRGSDVDAALHYPARMLEAGEDPRFIARRVVIAASEDVRARRPHRPADGRGGHARRRPDRHARGPDHPGPGRGPQCAGAEVQRRLHRRQRGDRRRARAAAGRSRPTCGSGYAGATRLGHGKGLRLRPRRAGCRRRPAVPPDDLAGTTDYYRPTDRGFEARLQERWTWLRGCLGRG